MFYRITVLSRELNLYSSHYYLSKIIITKTRIFVDFRTRRLGLWVTLILTVAMTFLFKPLAEEMEVRMIAPMRILAERESFRKFPVKNCLQIAF